MMWQRERTKIYKIRKDLADFRISLDSPAKSWYAYDVLMTL